MTIDVSEPGTLGDLFAEKVPEDDFGKITEMTVTGTISNEDLDLIAKLCRGDEFNLQNVDLHDANLLEEEIWSEMFVDCIKLKSMRLPKNLKGLSSHAFWRCYNVESYEFPETLESISYECFSDNFKLCKVRLPESLKSIGGQAFWECPLELVVCAAPVPPTIDFDAFPHLPSNSVLSVPDIEAYREAFGWGVFSDYTSLYSGDEVIVEDGKLVYVPATTTGKFVVPSDVTEVSAGAFYRCTGITEVEFPASVTKIPAGIFKYLSEDVKIKAHISLFDNDKLYFVSVDETEYTITNKCKSIRPNAFVYSAALKDLHVETYAVLTPQEHSLDGLKATVYVYEPLLDEFKKAWGTGFTYKSVEAPDFSKASELELIANGWALDGNVWTSQNHGDNTSSKLSASISAEKGAVLKFDWTVSSEGCCDRLTVWIGDDMVLDEGGAVSGTFTYLKSATIIQYTIKGRFMNR